MIKERFVSTQLELGTNIRVTRIGKAGVLNRATINSEEILWVGVARTQVLDIYLHWKNILLALQVAAKVSHFFL